MQVLLEFCNHIVSTTGKWALPSCSAPYLVALQWKMRGPSYGGSSLRTQIRIEFAGVTGHGTSASLIRTHTICCPQVALEGLPVFSGPAVET